MDKKGNLRKFFSDVQKVWASFKQSYLFKIVSRFLSTVCSIILVILLVIGAMMFYFNLKIKAYAAKGMEYSSPFGLYTIVTGSMEPNVEVFDVVIAVDEETSNIKIGDIITFISTWDMNAGLTITHRVVGISKTSTGEIQLTTKGDNNPTPDGSYVTQSNLIGKVVGRLPQLGRLQFFLAKKIGWFFVVFIPAMIIIIMDSIKIFKLYVLKNQIDNVKTPKEAKKDLVVKNLEERKTEIKQLNNKVLSRRVEADANVDTVELPKVGDDGIIKENTLELHVIKKDVSSSDEVEEIGIMNVNIEYPREKNERSVDSSRTGNQIPILKRPSGDVEHREKLPKRNKLERRD